jgi:hypothetical protein
MKKLLLIALAFTMTGAIAQTFQIQDPSGADVTDGTYNLSGPNSPADPFFKYTVNFTVVNTTGASITSKVKRIETGVLANTSHYHCYGICYSDILAGADYIFPESTDPAFLDYVDLAGAGTAVINTYFKPKTGVGTATFRFVVFDDANPNDSAYVDIVYDIHAFTGVEDLKQNLDVKLFPNPANNNATVSFSGNELESGNMTLEVSDMLGKKQKEIQLAAAQKQVAINTESLKAGIYFVSIRKDGQVLRTSKLMVKH